MLIAGNRTTLNWRDSREEESETPNNNMNLKLLFCPGFLLLLIVSQSQAGARSISSLQGAPEQPEESEPAALPAAERPRGGPGGDGAVRSLLGDLLGLSRRARGRSKKGPPRGCFGVRLDRIGSLSGLGC